MLFFFAISILKGAKVGVFNLIAEMNQYDLLKLYSFMSVINLMQH